MIQTVLQGFPLARLDGGFVGVTDASGWVEIANVDLSQGFDIGLLQIDVGAGGALGALKLTRTAVAGGLHVDWYEDEDFDTATTDFPSTQPAAIYNLSANTSGIITFGGLAGVAELKVLAKKAGGDTTARVRGSFQRQDM